MLQRLVRLLAIALLSVGSFAPAQAQQDYPRRPIVMVVPFAAGGPTDVLARILGERIGRTLGQQIVVENTLGGGGSIGTARVARAAPDGYTLVMGNLGTHAAAVGLYKTLSYDPRTDFEPVMLIGMTPMVLVTKKDFPTSKLGELIAQAKANPGNITYGSAGVGSISHLATIYFTSLTKTELRHVPYRGLSQAMNDLLGGQIDLIFDQAVSATPHIKSGSVKPIMVAATKRAKSLPDVPSSPEAGLPGFETTAWSALFAPKNTPKPVIDRLVAVIKEAFEDEAILSRMDELGSEVPAPADRTPEHLASLVSAEIDKWVPLIKAAGASAE